MSEKSRDLNLQGIILKKTVFRETSLILDVFTAECGNVPMMAKGVRRENSKVTGLLEILNELDLSVYKNPGSDWYIFKNGELLTAHLFETKYQTGVLMQAAAEIYHQLILDQNDFAELYHLLQQFLSYIRSIPQNGIAIFWRFLLKLFRLIGIEFNISKCVECGEENVFTAYYPQRHGFICRNCYRPVFDDYLIKLNGGEAEIFHNLMRIGNMLEELVLNKQTIDQINRIFLIHLSEHFHQRFYLKCLEMY